MKKLILISIAVFIYSTSLFSQYWEDLSSLTNPPNLPQMMAANGKIYVVSGIASGENPAVQEYDPATDMWTAKAVIPKGCYWSSAVSVGGKIYVMGGGHPYPGNTYNFIYDPTTDSWTQGADLLTPRMYHSATIANGKIYIMGGQNGDGTSEWYFDEYDPATDSWSRKAQLPHNGAWYSGAAGIGNYVYRIAGGGSNITLTKDYFDRYNITTDSWDILPAFRIPLHAANAVNYKERIILIGGYSNGYIDSMYEYDPLADKWEVMELKLPKARSYHRSAVIGDCIYVYGGHDASLAGTLIRHCDPYLGVENNSSSDFSFEIYPNPIANNLHIYLESAQQTETEIRIVDIVGREYYRKSVAFKTGKNSLEIDFINAPSGAYIIQLSHRDEVFSRKFMK